MTTILVCSVECQLLLVILHVRDCEFVPVPENVSITLSYLPLSVKEIEKIQEMVDGVNYS